MGFLKSATNLVFTLLLAGSMTAAVLLISSCAHYKTVPGDSPEASELSQALRTTLENELKRKYANATLQSFDLTSINEKADDSGKTKVTYSFSFTTNSKDTGEVAHQLDSEADLTRKGDTYTVKQALIRSQELVFKKPLEISRKK